MLPNVAGGVEFAAVRPDLSLQGDAAPLLQILQEETETSTDSSELLTVVFRGRAGRASTDLEPHTAPMIVF